MNGWPMQKSNNHHSNMWHSIVKEIAAAVSFSLFTFFGFSLPPPPLPSRLVWPAASQRLFA